MLQGSKVTPEMIDIREVQEAVSASFSIINNQEGEIGTCKKMVNLGCLNEKWKHLAVVYAKAGNAFSKAMVEKEFRLLKHLEKQGYPIVKVWGEVFTVQTTEIGERLGMIETYLPGTFIEAKTPKSLNLLITSALLNLTARSQEAWLAFHHSKLENDVLECLANPATFTQFKIRANHLAKAFEALLVHLKSNQEKIHDLQMILSHDGQLTVIDPLDVITDLSGCYESLIEKERLNDPSLVSFVHDTDAWLLQAQRFCQQLTKCASAQEVLGYCAIDKAKPLIFSTPVDHKGKSRLNQLKRSFPPAVSLPKASAKQKI